MMVVGLVGACGNPPAPGPARVEPGSGSGSATVSARVVEPGSGSGSAAPPTMTVAPARTCTEASAAIVHADQLTVVEVSATCVVTTAATWPAPADQQLLSAAWPSRGGPLYVAAGPSDEVGATVVLRYDQPRTAGGTAPVTMKAPGKGDVEPEGYTFAVVADDQGAYVERCKQWGEPCPDCEEVEEWPCQEHIYFPVAGGKQRKTAVAVDRFAMPLGAGAITGTSTLTRIDRETLQCQSGGRTETLDLGTWGPDVFVVAPLSATRFLLGQAQPGGRMFGARSVDYRQIDGCVEHPSSERIVVGPGGLWARTPGDGRQASAWTLHQGDLPLTTPVLTGRAVIWTR